MTNVTIQILKGPGTGLAAVVNFPEVFEQSKKYTAVVISHPDGGVKEQTSGLYARKLVESGLINVAVEDISAVVDYMATLSNVDVNVDKIGAMLLKGWDGSGKEVDALAMPEVDFAARASDITPKEMAKNPMTQRTPEAAHCEELRGAWEHYRPSRCQHPISPSFILGRSLPPVTRTFKAEVFLTQPILAVAGSREGSKWMTDDLVSRATSAERNLHVVEGAGHMEMYDKPQYVDEVVSKLAPLFQARLN
jgi:fermentation-respiration switch protein FrsA (DUF1100 family)